MSVFLHPHYLDFLGKLAAYFDHQLISNNLGKIYFLLCTCKSFILYVWGQLRLNLDFLRFHEKSHLECSLCQTKILASQLFLLSCSTSPLATQFLDFLLYCWQLKMAPFSRKFFHLLFPTCKVLLQHLEPKLFLTSAALKCSS